METGKTGRYFKYAIGEIVLVVIGILIALSINNWNESRIKQQELEDIYKTIKIDLMEDINAINGVLERMLPKETYFKKVIDKSVTKDDYLNDKIYRNLLFGYPDYAIQNRGFNLLTQYSDSYSSKKQELSQQIIRFYSVNLTEIRADEREIEVDFDDNSIYWKNNESWFADWNLKISDEGFINYALNSGDYRNRVSSFYFYYYRLLIPHLQTYITEAKIIIDAIDKRAKKDD
jgi:hypothetical protein